MKIKLAPTVYEPAEDTFLLIKALENLDLLGKKILEIGTGSGIISLILAKKAKHVTAVDIYPEALKCAKENAKLNGVKNVEFIESDLFQNIRGAFDIIVFNPPYLPSEPGFTGTNKDLCWDGGKDGREIIDMFLITAPEHLSQNGAIYLLESSLSQYEKTIQYFKKAGLKAEIMARKKLNWEELVVIRANI